MTALAMEKVGSTNFDEFVNLIEKLAEYEKLSPPDAGAKERLAADAQGENPKYEAYLGKTGDTAVGYMTFYFTYSTFLAQPTLFLEDIFVREEYRGQGLGRQMLDFCRKVARDRGCGRMEWMVLDWNLPAIRFYEKTGARRLAWYVYRLDHDQL
ncbi:GNAT family N-acetyltransferase [Methanoregula sp.]|uniref:GNAT family N-acetyltransferase n=1 Tax=Methanoregula sp. TaxID=2052170 RepID=UPI0025DF0E8A|nr:GNAT family N-acetyltransferase [Methanoregula sp.]